MPKFTYDAFMALVAKEKAAAANKAVEEAAAEKAANKTAATEEAAREAAAAEEADEFRSNKRDEGKRQKTDKDGGKWVFTGRGWVGQRLKRYWDEDGTKFYLKVLSQITSQHRWAQAREHMMQTPSWSRMNGTTWTSPLRVKWIYLLSGCPLFELFTLDKTDKLYDCFSTDDSIPISQLSKLFLHDLIFLFLFLDLCCCHGLVLIGLLHYH